MKKKVFVLGLVMCLLMVSLVSAKDDGGIVGSISKFFSSIVDGFMNAISSFTGGGKDKPSKTTPTSIVCNPPYMRYGSGCCLDADASGVCDRDEAASTTTSKPTTTTKATTTSSSTSTTTTSTTSTTIVIACARSSDCGEEATVRICYKGDVYRQRIVPFCDKPATPEAKCMNRTNLEGASMMSSPVPTETCSGVCKDGECV